MVSEVVGDIDTDMTSFVVFGVVVPTAVLSALPIVRRGELRGALLMWSACTVIVVVGFGQAVVRGQYGWGDLLLFGSSYSLGYAVASGVLYLSTRSGAKPFTSKQEP